MAKIPNLCDLCGSYAPLRRVDRFTVDMPDLDLIHTAHSEYVGIGSTGESTGLRSTVHICYGCTPSVTQWLSWRCSLCGDPVDERFLFKHLETPEFEFVTCIDCSGWERKEE